MPVLNFSKPLSHSWQKATSGNPSTSVPVALPQRSTSSILQSFIEMTSNLGHRLRARILSSSGVAINQLAINYRCTAMLLVCFALLALFSHPCFSSLSSAHQQYSVWVHFNKRKPTTRAQPNSFFSFSLLTCQNLQLIRIYRLACSAHDQFAN